MYKLHNSKMKHQFLPHYFKYIGLTLYLIVGFLPSTQAFINGFYGRPEETQTLGIPLIFFSHIFEILKLSGILLYALAKDKVFDEFMVKIRLESMYIVFFITLVFIFIRFIIDQNWHMSASYLLEAQVVLFLVLNKIRKQLITS